MVLTLNELGYIDLFVQFHSIVNPRMVVPLVLRINLFNRFHWGRSVVNWMGSVAHPRIVNHLVAVRMVGGRGRY